MTAVEAEAVNINDSIKRKRFRVSLKNVTFQLKWMNYDGGYYYSVSQKHEPDADKEYTTEKS